MEKRLLAIFAHPDDETYGPAGTISQTARDPQGKVRVVISTRGESGSLGVSKQYAPHDLARIRQAEMINAARILNAELRFLGFPDGAVETVDPDRARSLIVREIRLFKPAVLVTFHPNGLSGHPDHKAVTRFVTDAWERAADPAFEKGLPPWSVERLFYHCLTESHARRLESVRKVHTVPDRDVDAIIDAAPFRAAKHAAARAHKTQTEFYGVLQNAAGGIDELWQHETLILGRSTSEKPAGVIRDLFEGLAGNGSPT